MDSETANARSSRMWAKLGRALERIAYERTTTGNVIDLRASVEIAALAEGCFWQATGEGEAFDLPRKSDG